MAFWSSYFHRSDADDSLARTLRGIRENVVAMQVVLGNETTENSLVHDVKVLKSDVEMDKEQDRQLVSRMDSVKTASDQLKEEVETVRKMKGPKGEQGDRGPKGESGSVGPQGERGLRGNKDRQIRFIFSLTLLRMHTITFTFTRADSSRSKGRVKIIIGQETYWILQAKPSPRRSSWWPKIINSDST